jgi:multisubunit Na+/H+ antiporter MnhG subunit
VNQIAEDGKLSTGGVVGMLIAVAVTFIVAAALYSVFKNALVSFDSAMSNSISAAILLVAPIAVGVGLLLYVLDETGIYRR